LSKDAIDQTLEHITQLVGSAPSLWDLLHVRRLWDQLDDYWETFSEEVQKRIGNNLPLRILDFDIIYPAFWPAEVRNPLYLEERMGFPMTAAFVFRDTKSHFTIPPGAFFELRYHLLKLEKSYRVSEDRLAIMTQKIERVRAKALLNEAGHAAEAMMVLKDMSREFELEVDNMLVTGTKVQALSNILDHPYYVPWKTLTKTARTDVDPEEIIRLWKIFGAERTHPEKDLNNYLDALNVASYYAFARVRSGRTRRLGFFPLFASGTRVILQLGSQPKMSEEEESILEAPLHPVSIQYLAFATALEIYAEHNPDRLASLADTGLNEIQRLRRRWTRFWGDFRRKYPLPSRRQEAAFLRSFPVARLGEFSSFRDLCDSYSKWRANFDGVVGTVFLDITRADRQMSESFVRTKRHLLNQVSGTLPGSEPIKMLSISEAASSFEWTRTSSAVEAHLLLNPRSDRMVEDDTLEALRKAGMLSEEGEVFPDPVPTLRTTVLLSDVKQTLFYWERTVRQKAQLCCWDYDLNIFEVLGFVRDFVEAARGKANLDNFNLEVYSDDRYGLAYVKPASGSEAWLDAVLKISPEPTYLRVDTPLCIVFLDLRPSGQATALEIAVLYETPKLHSQVARLYQQTSKLPVSRSVVTSLLTEFAQDFKRKEPLIVSLADATRAQGELTSKEERNVIAPVQFALAAGDTGGVTIQ
jgi:hypothetical protein